MKYQKEDALETPTGLKVQVMKDGKDSRGMEEEPRGMESTR